MRLDLSQLKPGEQEIAELELLLARRRDLITDQSRTITRLRETLLSLFPALERTLDLNRKGPLTLLTHYQTPAQLRRAGHKRIAAYLRNRGVKGFNNVAQKALGAARSQSVTLPAQNGGLPHRCRARQRSARPQGSYRGHRRGARAAFFARPEAPILSSLPGMGALLGAEFLLAVVGDLAAFQSADRLAPPTPGWCLLLMTLG